ncbi:hypothetical protein BC832DRAFT_618533 [Gaertneriomyces semiglobifer]|nr:hypothetical protein BC832DRAFT_618533 [Gaertneriomyces semiglobifer]
MAQKVELEAWINGCGAYADQNYDAALDAFSQIADTSRIHFNIAMCFIGLNAIDEAIQALTRSISCDPYLAVAYYMRGVCLYNSSALNDALQDFNDALTYLRGNPFIDYAQLGLAFKLHTCKVSFNRGLCLAAMGQVEAAVQDFSDAQRSMPSPSENTSGGGGGGGDLGQINQALNQPARAHQLFGPFSVPSDLIYTPPKGRVKNAEKRDYIGKAKVVAAVEATNNYAGFSGRELKAKTLPRSNTTGNINTTGNGMTAASLNRGGLQPPSSVTLPRSYTTGDLRRPNPNLGRSNTLASGNGGGGGRYPTIGRSGLSGGSSNNGAQRPLPQTLGRSSGASSTFQRRAEPSVYAMDGLIDEFGGMDMNTNNGYSNNNNNSNSYNNPPQRSNPALNTFQRNNNLATSNRSSYTASDAGSMTSSYTGDKIKLKIHYTSTRIILLPSLSYSLLLSRIFGKFGIPVGQQGSVVLKYRDEDGTLCELMDEEDLMVCVDGRGEVWVYLE